MGRTGSCALSGLPLEQGLPVVKIMMTPHAVDWSRRCEIRMDTYNAQDLEWRHLGELARLHKYETIYNKEQLEASIASVEKEKPFFLQFGTYDEDCWSGMQDATPDVKVDERALPYILIHESMWKMSQEHPPIHDHREVQSPILNFFTTAYVLRRTLDFSSPILGIQFPDQKEYAIRNLFAKVLQKENMLVEQTRMEMEEGE